MKPEEVALKELADFAELMKPIAHLSLPEVAKLVHQQAARIAEAEDAIRKWVKISDDLADFDGDRRGILSARLRQENVLRKLVGATEIEDDY